MIDKSWICILALVLPVAGLEIIDGRNQGVWGTGPGAELSVLAEWIDLHLNGLKLCLNCQSFHCFTPAPPPKTRHCVLLWVQYYFNEADKRNTIEVAACSVCPLLHSRAQYTAECRRRVSISIQRQMKHDHIFQLTKSNSTLQAPPPAPLTRWTRLRLVSAPAVV